MVQKWHRVHLWLTAYSIESIKIVLVCLAIHQTEGFSLTLVSGSMMRTSVSMCNMYCTSWVFKAQ